MGRICCSFHQNLRESKKMKIVVGKMVKSCLELSCAEWCWWKCTIILKDVYEGSVLCYVKLLWILKPSKFIFEFFRRNFNNKKFLWKSQLIHIIVNFLSALKVLNIVIPGVLFYAISLRTRVPAIFENFQFLQCLQVLWTRGNSTKNSEMK